MPRTILIDGGVNVGRSPRVCVPSSGAAAFTPASIAGLQLWVEADSGTGTTTDGTAVGTWTDQSGQGHHLTQATAGSQPVYKTNILNGKPVVRFDGVDDFLTVTFTQSQPIHAFVVTQFRTARTGNNTIMDGGGDGWARIYWFSSTQVGLYATANQQPNLTVAMLNTFHVLSALFNGASSELRADGGTAVVGDPGTTAPGGLTLGGRGGLGLEPGAVDIAACIAYSGILSTTNRQAVESYLKGKYGTP